MGVGMGVGMGMYNIVIEYYRTIKDIEAGKPCKVESGFNTMTLKEAEACKSKMSKMSNHPTNGYHRINKIIEVGVGEQ